jgi:hypothetical protein
MMHNGTLQIKTVEREVFWIPEAWISSEDNERRATRHRWKGNKW